MVCAAINCREKTTTRDLQTHYPNPSRQAVKNPDTMTKLDTITDALQLYLEKMAEREKKLGNLSLKEMNRETLMTEALAGRRFLTALVEIIETGNRDYSRN